MQQQPLDYRAPTTGLAVHWTRKPLYWLLFIVPSLPLLIFLIPRGMTLLSEPTDPWYTRYTTPVWLLAAFYVYPATALGMLVGARPMSPGWILIVLLYTGLIGWGTCSWTARRRAAARVRKDHGLRLLGFLLIIPLLATAPLAAAEPPMRSSKSNELARVAAEMRSLEAKPVTDNESRRQRSLLFQWLSDSPDVHLKWCAGILTDMPTEDQDYWAGVIVQVILSAGAFVIEHPDEASNDLHVARAGLVGALRAYRATLSVHPERTSSFLATLAAQEDAGNLDGYITPRMSNCK